MLETSRKLPVGAEIIPGKGAHFRVWAPEHQRIDVVFSRYTGDKPTPRQTSFELTADGSGYFSGLADFAKAGDFYFYRIDNQKETFPDPVSRFQPRGPLGPSELIDPLAFRWTDNNWKGITPSGQVFYEMHIGTFTPEGTFASAAKQLASLADLGITAIELMPVAEFSGRHNWGYDGVDFFAPTHNYGRPEELRRFIDQSHAQGIGVILDVVYNHLGPVGNFLAKFSKSYFTTRYKNEWGEAINFDGPDAGPVREFFISNAAYWIDEYHLDGLRLDATQQIFDRSPEHILTAISRKVRDAAGRRSVFLAAENEPQHIDLVKPFEECGCGLDAVWNDDFHHTAMVALTGHNEAYYSEYLGTPQELVSSIKWGYLYQGQYYTWQKHRRGTPAYGLPPFKFINYLQNHDQIANSCCGVRMPDLTSPSLYRAMTALLLLAPQTPLLFQGQEFAASSSFYYFSDISPDLAESIHRSRLKFLGEFNTLAQPEMQSNIPRPDDPLTFNRSILDLSEREKHGCDYALHRDLLHLRKEDPVFSSQRTGGVDGAVLGFQSFVLRFFGDNNDDRLMITNMGKDFQLLPAPEPLLAPPAKSAGWEILWSSESPRYGGAGTPSLNLDTIWKVRGQSTVILRPAIHNSRGYV